MTAQLNYYLAQQLIDDRVRVARERQASLQVTENHKGKWARALAGLLQSRRPNQPTQPRTHAQLRHRSH